MALHQIYLKLIYNMNKISFSKLLTLIFLTFLVFNCSSSEETETPVLSDLTLLNKAKIVGTWFQSGQCEAQNIFTYNSDLSYEIIDSGNIDCNSIETATYRLTGTYDIVDDQLFYNELTNEIIIDCDCLSTQEFESLVTKRITVLNETTLHILTIRSFNNQTTESTVVYVR